MKILDEKGKIFGKINIIDLTFLVIAVIIMVCCANYLQNKDTAVPEPIETDTLTYTVECHMIDPAVAAYAETQIDTQLMSKGEMQPAYLRSCTSEVEMVAGEDGKIKPDETMRTVTCVIEAESPCIANSYAIGSQELRVGKFHIVKTTALEIDGRITSMDAPTIQD